MVIQLAGVSKDHRNYQRTGDWLEPLALKKGKQK